MPIFTPTQLEIVEQLRHTRGSPISVARLVIALYGSRYDGGPVNAGLCVRVHVHNLRRTLKAHGVRLLTIGAPGRGGRGYMIDPEDLDKLEVLHIKAQKIEIDEARARLAAIETVPAP